MKLTNRLHTLPSHPIKNIKLIIFFPQLIPMFVYPVWSQFFYVIEVTRLFLLLELRKYSWYRLLVQPSAVRRNYGRGVQLGDDGSLYHLGSLAGSEGIGYTRDNLQVANVFFFEYFSYFNINNTSVLRSNRVSLRYCYFRTPSMRWIKMFCR
ncbi:hypothetical protein DICVIV_07424 [Dictyocaulus viviparus]|uniref:Uncharacterized protein n=1 Tax=Dictyocaulus viviparus TaxID=29172 RepID=A0A0D8XPQ0_DICVI|nr:hypothetical protein DICVIV_07424 [Dictyocaulus viviparus]